MKDLLKVTAATAALALGMTSANAAMLLGTDAHGEKKVINTETGEDFSVLEQGAGQATPQCPEGAFLISPDPADESNTIATDCTTQNVYRMQGEDTFRAHGLAYPEGTFFLTPGESHGQADVKAEEELEGEALQEQLDRQ